MVSRLLAEESLQDLPVGHQEFDESDGPDLEPGVPSARVRSFNLRDDNDIRTALNTRVWAISYAIRETIERHQPEIISGIKLLERWLRERAVVRVVGAGRALHAASLPANRLAHCGGDVHVINDVVPLPNSRKGGGIIAASASGKTEAVLGLMDQAKDLNKDIVILGIADAQAGTFRELCDIFIGIELDGGPYENRLQALADTGEYVISELLDAMVVAAGMRLGMTDEDFRSGHEDLGATGPYRPKSR